MVPSRPVEIPPRGVLSVRSSRDGNVIASYNPLVLIHLARRIDPHELRILSQLIEQGLSDGIAGGLLFVFDRKDIAGGIDPNARKLFEDLLRNRSTTVGLSGVVVLSDGFAGAVARSFVGGLLAVFGARDRLRVFPSVTEACRALARAHDLDASRLERAYVEAAVKG